MNMSNVKWKLVYLDQNQHRKKHQRLYERMIFIICNMGENIVVIIHIYGDTAILPLFCNHQDTEYE